MRDAPAVVFELWRESPCVWLKFQTTGICSTWDKKTAFTFHTASFAIADPDPRSIVIAFT